MEPTPCGEEDYWHAGVSTHVCNSTPINTKPSIIIFVVSTHPWLPNTSHPHNCNSCISPTLQTKHFVINRIYWHTVGKRSSLTIISHFASFCRLAVQNLKYTLLTGVHTLCLHHLPLLQTTLTISSLYSQQSCFCHIVHIPILLRHLLI